MTPCPRLGINSNRANALLTVLAYGYFLKLHSTLLCHKLGLR